ncbi:putative DNA-binding domain-containing protein [Rosa chinensis]|uniref:Putative DNA-binding domain-containing protein n=2 Tax=Rosa chinensis TaxID=74649 RepID=A0A2P6QIA2_ROSCH|nr:putative DNA-binding domain-containing protein [Rosa chinensis]
MNTPKSSSPEPIPLMTVTPAKEEDQPRSSRQLQLVTASRFGLPDGWSVEERPRRSSQTVDKYYIELDTGLKFRSLAAARRYLTDGQIDTRTRREKSGSQSTMQSFRRSSSFTLPDGWEIEERPRKNTNSSHSDKYYIEPGSGKRFRSLISVERYLTEEIEHTPLQELMPANKSNLSSSSGSQKKKIRSLELISKHSPCSNECYNSTLDAMRLNTYSTPEKHSSSPKKSISGETSRPSELTNGSPPTKVKWVLAGPGGNMWNPFIDDSRVADSVKQMWSEIFKSSIYNENAKAPRS